MNLSEVLTECTLKSIAKGGSSSRGTTAKDAIDYLVYKYTQIIKAPASFKPVRTVQDFIYNIVAAQANATLRLKQGLKEERESGKIMITSLVGQQGWLQEEGKQVTFVHRYPVKLGEIYDYKFRQGVYSIQNDFLGACKNKHHWSWTSGYDTLFRIGDEVALSKYVTNDDASLVTFAAGAQANVPASEQIWHKDAFTYGYFDGKNYRETAAAVAGAEDLSIDCSAYMLDAAGGSAVSNGGVNYTKYPGATKAMKVLFYGKYRLVILATFYDTYNNTEGADFYEVGVFDLLIINTETSSVTKLGPTHSTWSNIKCPVGMYVGYVDVQINKETGKLLVMKSADSPTTTSLNVKYYVEADPVTDPQIYNHSTVATIYRVPFQLDEMTVNMSGVSLDLVQNLYTDDGIISLIDGVSVIGGVTSAMFTQQPESYNIYINRHIVAYKQQDTVPTTPDEVANAYRVLAYGRWEFYGITEAAIIGTSPHSTASGAKTTTAVSDMAILVVPSYIVPDRIVFIREFISARDRLAVDNQMWFYEHTGATYTGKPSSETTYYTFSGSSNINLSYASAEGSHLQDDRFIVLTDGSNTKVLWACKVQVLYNWIDDDPIPDTEHFSMGYTQGYTFFKSDIEAYEMNLLDTDVVGGSQRWNGAFVSNTDPTLIEYTYGLNNLSTFQLTDSEFLCTVSRCERVDYLEVADWSTRSASEVLYTAYALYAKAVSGGLAGAVLPGSGTVDSHDLTETAYLTKLAELQAIAALWT